MFMVEFLLGSLAFAYRDTIKHTFTEKLQDGLSHHYNMSQSHNNLLEVWDDVQVTVSFPAGSGQLNLNRISV